MHFVCYFVLGCLNKFAEKKPNFREAKKKENINCTRFFFSGRALMLLLPPPKRTIYWGGALKRTGLLWIYGGGRAGKQKMQISHVV
jgi:hypothetical protein